MEIAHPRPDELAPLIGELLAAAVECQDDPWEEVFDEDYLYFYADRLAAEPSERETEQILALLDLPPGAAVLDAPCGHGRIANRLAARGLRVVGLDSNPDFLALARRDAAEAGVDVEYVHGDLRELPWSGQFDAALNWYTSFGYFDDEANSRALSAYRRALKPGGRLLLEQINRDSLLRQIPAGGSRLVALTERGDDLMIDMAHLDLLEGPFAHRAHHRPRRPRPTSPVLAGPTDVARALRLAAPSRLRADHSPGRGRRARCGRTLAAS